MLAVALFLSAALVHQVPPADAEPAQAPEARTPVAPPAVPKAQALPVPPAPRSTLERKRAIEAKKRADRARRADQQRQYEREMARQWQEYVRKVGPILAEQQRQQWQQQMQAAQLQLEARRTAAIEEMARAAQRDATTNQQRAWQERQRYGP